VVDISAYTFVIKSLSSDIPVSVAALGALSPVCPYVSLED
jgi:hypothetical protein